MPLLRNYTGGSMFYFRLNKIKIKNNREPRKFLLFGPSNAEVKIYSFFTTGDVVLPEIDEILTTDNKKQRTELFQKVMDGIVNSKVFTEVKNVKDNSEMTFGDSGSLVYKSQEIPDELNWTLVVMESDKDIRDFGGRVDQVVRGKEFQKYAADLLLIAGTIVNPAYGAAVGLTKYFCHYMIDRMKKNKDDLIGLTSMSLNRQEHYPHGERKVNDVWDLSNNMQIDYSMFGFDEEEDGE